MIDQISGFMTSKFYKSL